MNKYLLFFIVFLNISSGAAVAEGCEIVRGGTATAYDGRVKALEELQVEKKSLIPLNMQFPELKVIEKAFKGELQTCTNCVDKYIACK